MFFCAISGSVPLVPVVSAKSGHVYEKSLIERYIEENGNDPITGDGLTKDDLVDVKAKPSTLPPRAPTQTSIPSLLNSLQSEFDAIMLESLEIKKAYKQARQELANALYRSDAAERAIARLIKERDEARNALASVQATIGHAAPAPAANGQTEDVEMQVEETPAAEATLSKDLLKLADETNAALSATRRKRKPPPGYSNADAIKGFSQTSSIPSLHATKPAGITAFDLSESGTLALTGGADKTVQIYDFLSGTTSATMKGHTKAVNHVAFVDATEGSRNTVSGSADKTVKFWSESASDNKWSLSANFKDSQKGDIVGLAVHPSKKMVASASSDATWALHDLTTLKTVATYEPIGGVEGSFAYTSFVGHPDGILIGGGTTDGTVRVWDIRDKHALATSIEGHASPLASLSFSENGYLLATASSGAEPTIQIVDLRKLSVVKSWTLPTENKINEIRFDSSAQFLTVVGTDARIYMNKTWEELLKFEDNAGDLTGARFGPMGQQLVLSGMDRTLRLLGAAA